ncbi:hypothetical protein [Devosia sp.]|uniref:hypothetical protein n=1 Tax=Devosia sp. TaxID=1871048 RepID=UPI003A90A38F
MSGLSARGRALVLVAIAALVAVLVAVAVVSEGSAPPAPSAEAVGAGDAAAYARIIAEMQSGGGYHDSAQNVLRAEGYGTRSVFNWRTPAWPILVAGLGPALAQAFLGALALFALALTYRMARPDGLAVAAIATLAVGSSLFGIAAPEAVYFTEIAAGTLILLSVAAYGAGWRWIGLLAGLIALFVRELAAPYVLVCLVIALWQRRWREAAGWAAGMAVYALYFGWHWWEVARRLGAEDRAYPDSWLQFGGMAFLLKTSGFNGLWSLAPVWVTALILPVALFGLWAWRGGGRALAVVAAYLTLFALVGKPFNSYWGALYTPVMMLGFGWAWLALREAFAGKTIPA